MKHHDTFRRAPLTNVWPLSSVIGHTLLKWNQWQRHNSAGFANPLLLSRIQKIDWAATTPCFFPGSERAFQENKRCSHACFQHLRPLARQGPAGLKAELSGTRTR